MAEVRRESYWSWERPRHEQKRSWCIVLALGSAVHFVHLFPAQGPCHGVRPRVKDRCRCGRCTGTAFATELGAQPYVTHRLEHRVGSGLLGGHALRRHLQVIASLDQRWWAQVERRAIDRSRRRRMGALFEAWPGRSHADAHKRRSSAPSA